MKTAWKWKNLDREGAHFPGIPFESATGKKNDGLSFLRGACDKKQKSYLCPESPFIGLTGSEDTNKFGLKIKWDRANNQLIVSV